MSYFYSFCIFIYLVGINIASVFRGDAKAWVAGRREPIKNNKDKHIWIHCASLGEYKQSLPLVKLIEKDNPNIIISFFSPSGYNHADTQHKKQYLPIDLKYKLRPFIKAINPSLLIIVRNEFWFNMLDVVQEKNIPVVYINCAVRQEHLFMKYPFNFFKTKLSKISHFFTLDDNSRHLLSQEGFSQVSLVGDTKFDQVDKFDSNKVPHKKINSSKPIFLFASMEAGDDKYFFHLLTNISEDFNILYVPHQPSENHFLNFSTTIYSDVIKYSEYEKETSSKLLYVDVFGILPELYSYAKLCYIGGGFDKGVHNLLEACAHGKPMIFGPNHYKYPEANQLIKLRVGMCIHNMKEMEGAIQHYSRQADLIQLSNTCNQFIAQKRGASKKIYTTLKQLDIVK